jgi:hypothetical protein
MDIVLIFIVVEMMVLFAKVTFARSLPLTRSLTESRFSESSLVGALAAVEPLSSVTAVLGAWFPVASFSAAEASGTVGTLELSSLVPGLFSLASCFPPFSFHVVAMEGEGSDVAFLIGLLLL